MQVQGDCTLSELLAGAYRTIIPARQMVGVSIESYRQKYYSIARQLIVQRPDDTYADGLLSTDRRVLTRAVNSVRRVRVTLCESVPNNDLTALQDTVDRTQKYMRMWAQLLSILRGFREEQREIDLLESMAVGEILRIENPKPHKTLGLSILNIEGLSETLTAKQQALIRLFVPCEIRRKPNQKIKRSLDGTVVVPLENCVSSSVTEQQLAQLNDITEIKRDVLRAGVARKYRVSFLTMTDPDTEMIKDRLKLEGAKVHQSVSRSWDRVAFVLFDLRTYVEEAVDTPNLLESEQETYKYSCSCLDEQNTEIMCNEHLPLTLLIWFDQWRDISTAVKIRLYDPSGFVFPTKLTSPHRLLEYEGAESDLWLYKDTIMGGIDQLLGRGFQVRNTGRVAFIQDVVLLGDTKCMQVVLGTMRGGDFPVPSCPIERSNLARAPACTVRLTVGDVESSRDSFEHDMDQGNAVQFDVYGRFPRLDPAAARRAGHLPARPLFKEFERAAGFLICPPVMHVSHELLQRLAATAALFFKPNPLERNIEIERTTGCNEMSEARRRLALFATNIAEDHPTSSFFLLAAQLQAHYYSAEPVTDDLLEWHRITAVLVHLFVLVCSLVQDNQRVHTVGPSASSRLGIPTVQSTKGHASCWVLPAVQAKLKIPLFYLLEEYLERGFIANADMKQHLHNNGILQDMILREQVKMYMRLKTGHRSGRRKDSQVPPVRRKILRIHSCLKDAKWWAEFRSELVAVSPRGRMPEISTQHVTDFMEDTLANVWHALAEVIPEIDNWTEFLEVGEDEEPDDDDDDDDASDSKILFCLCGRGANE